MSMESRVCTRCGERHHGHVDGAMPAHDTKHGVRCEPFPAKRRESRTEPEPLTDFRIVQQNFEGGQPGSGRAA